MDTGSQGHLEIPGARSLLLATLPYSWHFHWGAHGEQAQNSLDGQCHPMEVGSGMG